jgi:predicted small secreted protein
MSRRSLAALLVACALVLASCGDDSGSGGENAGNEDVDAGGGDGGDVSQSDVDAFFSGDCSEAVQAFNAAIVSSSAALVPGGEGTAEDTAAQLDAMAEAAPDEISDDFAVWADAYGEFAQALADAGIDYSDPSSFQSAEAIAALQSVGEIFDEGEFDEASANIESWFDANCAAP